jgi:hypothetical protein
VDGAGSGSSPIADFGVSGDELPGSAIILRINIILFSFLYI